MKMRLLGIVVILYAALCVSAASPPDWQMLLRQGDAAYARGDYTAAAALYEQAGDRTIDPGLVAFDLAAAQYRLALASDADRMRLSREAEQSYRCCIELGDARRARALYGLGNALLLRAGDRDADALKAAVESYRQCLAETNLDEALADEARHNLERARLLLLQIPPSAGHSKDESSGDVPPKPQISPREKPGAQKNPTHDPATGVGKPDKSGDPTKPEKGTKPVEIDAEPQPGSGHLPPVPDGADLPPLTAEDAARHLELASQRIEEDYKAHRRAKAPAPAANVRDW
jgi:tetratricopeptide (TPR) repeat protein